MRNKIRTILTALLVTGAVVVPASAASADTITICRYETHRYVTGGNHPRVVTVRHKHCKQVQVSNNAPF